jgi:hypothetical protein
MEKLTPEQIANWRRALIPMYGCLVSLMPDYKIQEMRDSMQEWSDKKKGERLAQEEIKDRSQ